MAKLTAFSPNSTTTLNDFVRAGKKLSISHESITLKYQLNDDLIIPLSGLLQKYRYALSSYIQEMELADDEYEAYRFKPKLLSLDLYGTPELWSDLLYINHMMAVADFDRRTIKVYTPSIIEALTEIQMLSKQDIKKNRASLTE